jgi:hypothetical protein
MTHSALAAALSRLTVAAKTRKMRVLSGGSLFPEWGVAKLVKAPDFDSGMRRFESFLPSQQIARAGSG